MKKIAFLLLCLTFSVSVSAHQQTTTFSKEIASKTFALESSEAYAAMYTGGNGGIIQLIYNAFYKLGSFVSSSLNDDETPSTDSETNTEN
ncbi:hypothetical protein [Kordia jejudonensis]|uniref:hypothetical protein n=1 Tax=Kordia jejudonensis TaxID=1348245 RepID=UPI0006295B03|nr:hypothetical protein [Kordia jejudonensis]